MIRLILRRLLSAFVVMAIVAVLVFMLIHLSPGDPAAVIAGEHATTQDIERVRATLGLDQPLIVQFWFWLERLLHGDLGISLFSRMPVATLVASRLEPTLALSLLTIVFAVGTAIRSGSSLPGRSAAGRSE